MRRPRRLLLETHYGHVQQSSLHPWAAPLGNVDIEDFPSQTPIAGCSLLLLANCELLLDPPSPPSYTKLTGRVVSTYISTGGFTLDTMAVLFL